MTQEKTCCVKQNVRNFKLYYIFTLTAVISIHSSNKIVILGLAHKVFPLPASVLLQHIFCEDCVSMWFDRERTCPMCRANIVDNPQWRDGSTSSNLQIY